LPNSLWAILADPQVPVYGADGGFDTRAGTWHPPAVVTPEQRAAAKAALGERLLALATNVTGRQAVEWVLSLAMLTAGRAMSTEDAKARATAYASMLADYPAAVLTRESLQRAATDFKFFPSYAELVERLDVEVRRLKREQRKLEQLAEVIAPPTREQSTIRAAVRPMPGARKSDAVKAEPKPEKASAIVQPASAEQLAEWAKACGVPA